MQLLEGLNKDINNVFPRAGNNERQRVKTIMMSLHMDCAMASLKVLVITVAKALPHPLHPPAHGISCGSRKPLKHLGGDVKDHSLKAEAGLFLLRISVGYQCLLTDQQQQPEFPSPLGQCGPCSN